jgi:hypothetical protein
METNTLTMVFFQCYNTIILMLQHRLTRRVLMNRKNGVVLLEIF